MTIEEAWAKMESTLNWHWADATHGGPSAKQTEFLCQDMTAARDLALAVYNHVLTRAVEIADERYGTDSAEFGLLDKIIQVLEEERAQIEALGGDAP